MSFMVQGKGTLVSILLLTILWLVLASTSVAHAVTITWNTTGSDSTNPGGGTLAPDVGNIKSFTSTSGGHTLKAAGFSMATLTSTLEKAYLAAYGGGLGIGNAIQSTSSETGSPGHAVDNVGAYDMVIFAFGSDKWDPISARLTPYGSEPDSDLTYLVGGKLADFGTASDPFSSFAGKTLAQITSLGTWYQHDDAGNGSTRTALLNPNNGTEYGRYLIVAGQFSGSDRDDYFKIDRIVGEPLATPEPSTILLLGSGLAGLAAWRRKKVHAHPSAS